MEDNAERAQKSIDSRATSAKFNGSSSYTVDGGTFTLRTSDLPQGKSYYTYDLTFGEKGCNLYVDFNALTAGGKIWVINVSLPEGSTGVDFNFFAVNNISIPVGNAISYRSNTNTTHMFFYTKGMTTPVSYVEVVLPGHPFGLRPSGTANMAPGDKWYNTVPGYCFLAGAAIETDVGLVSVERLKIGMNVMTFDERGNASGYRPVIWTGQNVGHVSNTGYDDIDNRPICVAQNAFGEGLPDADLLVTPEHCFLIDGVLVPARMLVNHKTVYYVPTNASYDYYHFKTAQHAIVKANGLLTETLRDDVRRFVPRGTAQPMASIAQVSAAPLCSDPALARMIHARIENRAIELGFSSSAMVRELTHDAALHLVLADGTRLEPVRVNDRWAVFSLPAGQTDLCIVSRHSRPCDVVGPFVDDRRELGVCVGEVTLFAAATTRRVTSHLDMDGGHGWHAGAQGDAMRWTSGNALLSLGAPLETQALLTIEIVHAGPYVARPAASSAISFAPTAPAATTTAPVVQAA